jgi:hypothetical protein
VSIRNYADGRYLIRHLRSRPSSILSILKEKKS